MAYCKRIVSISLSVLLYSLPFFFPDFCWPLIFLFPLPLLYLAHHHLYSFVEGFIWAAAILTIHLHGLFINMMHIAQGPIFWKLVPMVGLVSYLATVNGLIAWAAYLFTTKTNFPKSPFAQITGTTLGLFFFFIFMNNWCLFPFGVCEGYALTNPLLPLVSQPQLLRLLSPQGANFILGRLFLVPALLMAVYYHRTITNVILSLVICASWLALYVSPSHQPNIPAWKDEIVPLPLLFGRSHNLTFLATTVGEAIMRIIPNHKNATLIVLPETSLSCEFIGLPVLTHLWSKKHLGKPLHIIAGSYRWNKSLLHNSAYWVYNGVLQKCYDKQHGLILTERMPSWLRSTAIYHLFFKEQTEITPATNKRPLFVINDEMQLVPYICSELFFNTTPDDEFQDKSILALCNDIIMPPYIARLMRSAAQYKAIAWHRPIVYIAYRHQTFFDQWGNAQDYTAYKESI
jgi:hypothetical protein